MARLPYPGGDKGNWGEVLNEYLTQSLDTGGALKADSVSNTQVAASAAIAQSKIANLTTDLAGKASTTHTHATTDITSGTLTPARLPVATDIAIGAVELATTTEARTGTDTTRAVTPAGIASAIASNNAVTPWNYGVYPKVIWTGTSWPTRASVLPVGYTGAVEYWSPTDSAATSPTDRITGDIWTRVGTA